MRNNKIVIRELNNSNDKILSRLSSLHMKAFPNFFLTQLGYTFLKTLYKGYSEDENAGLIIAEKDGNIVGFIAYSKDYSNFFKGLVKRHLNMFFICSIGAIIKHPTFTKRLLGAFGKSESVKKPEKYVELASICVDPENENSGIGSLLIDYLKSIVDFEQYEFINLETDAIDNDAVNIFYQKNGFVLERQYITAENRKMNEYRYRE